MASINNLPQGATKLEEIAGVIEKPDAWTHGKQVSFARYSAYCSKGYKSDYQAVLTEFLVLRIEGQRTNCKMYSGKRIAQAAKVFAGWKADLQPYLR